MNPNEQPPQAQIMGMINGKHLSRCVSLAAELGIPDVLKSGPKKVDEIARATDVRPDELNRVMRTLTAFGVFSEHGDGTYGNSPLSETLREDAPGSLRHYARWAGTGLHWRVTNNIDYSVKTGKPSILKDNEGDNAFEVLANHPEEQQIFNDAMTSLSKADGHAITEAYDWSRYNKITDVGGGHGLLAQMIAKEAPKAEVTVFDQEHVIEGTKKSLEQSGLDNINAESGDFFKEIPGTADLIVMKYIIHDWPDDKAVEILKNCKKALSENGKVAVCDMLITNGPEGIPAKIFDIEMMMGPGGKERTKEEFERLFDQAGFKLNNIVHTKSPIKIIEAVQA